MSARHSPSSRRAQRIPSSGVFPSTTRDWILEPIACEVAMIGAPAAELPERSRECDLYVTSSVTELERWILRHRGLAGVIVERTVGARSVQIVEQIRAVSRRAPVLLVGLREEHWAGPELGLEKCDRHALLEAGTEFLAYCEERAQHCHRSIERYAKLKRLTSAEADLIWRIAMGIRAGDVDRAQGIRRDTKKERIASIRTKTNIQDLDDVVDDALNRFW